jgi:hypothetical protein
LKKNWRNSTPSSRTRLITSSTKTPNFISVSRDARYLSLEEIISLHAKSSPRAEEFWALEIAERWNPLSLSPK